MHFSLLGPLPQLALSVEMLLAFLFVGAPPQLALSVGFHFESLFVGAPLLSVLVKGFVFCLNGTLMIEIMKKSISIEFQ
ncbi:hypothetical protein HMPREF2597_10615 [Staphylococcus sp. HMSC063A07]|nr:hypothetical protein B7454_09450 [Staphylococcus lugdunensis]ARJ16635.1 hypothetical protein B6N54_08525 [Staphylococcus lugdunensis]OHP79765.1 hypothetical protein HMPREF2597_10615 [Staphylococcus sp. HMSC063A07]OHQ41176.1 hypothetical protein HMPREF2584_06070 [Staphylococcus sp. HMSC069E09]